MFYSEEQINHYIQDLVEGRQKFTEEIASEGLREEILFAAERSFRIDKRERGKKVSVPETLASEEKPYYDWESKSRPRRGGFWRSR